MIEFLYSVITRENSKEAGLAADWWKKHEGWNVFVRTNIRYSKNPKVWLGGGGETFEEALKLATESVELDAEKEVTLDRVIKITTPKAHGKESPVMIRNP